MTILGSSFDTSDLTETEKKQYEKILELRAKKARMSANKKWKNEKENREDTLTKLENQIDSMEQSLYDRYDYEWEPNVVLRDDVIEKVINEDFGNDEKKKKMITMIEQIRSQKVKRRPQNREK
jgi:hypothetical protein